MFELLAQGVDGLTQTADWVQIATGMGFAGLVWYLIVKALPDVQNRFDTTLERQTIEMKVSKLALIDEINAGRTAFEKQMELQRASCKEEMQELTVVYERHMDRLFKEK